MLTTAVDIESLGPGTESNQVCVGPGRNFEKEEFYSQSERKAVTFGQQTYRNLR